jgi:hypothetical protein
MKQLRLAMRGEILSKVSFVSGYRGRVSPSTAEIKDFSPAGRVATSRFIVSRSAQDANAKR